mgnify:CR=1 FL=1
MSKSALLKEAKKLEFVIGAGMGAPVAVGHGMSCARVYVVVQAEKADLVAAAAKRFGLIFQKKAHYGYSNALYVGYDTGTGRVAAQGNGIVKAFEAEGIKAYLEFGED